MAVKKSNRGAGRPSDAKGSDVESIKTRSLHEISKFDASIVNKLPKLYALYQDIAFATGDFKDASVQNRKGAIETLITRGELYAKEEGLVQVALQGGGEDELQEEYQEEAKQVANGGPEPVLSFKEKRELWAKKQAEKSGE